MKSSIIKILLMNNITDSLSMENPELQSYLDI